MADESRMDGDNLVDDDNGMADENGIDDEMINGNDNESGDNTSDDENDSSEWSNKFKKTKIKDFTSDVGPTVNIPHTPIEVFRLFFSVQLIQMIVTESNRYASEVMGSEKYDTWNTFTPNDMLAFFGFAILMGINRLPSMDDYWKKGLLYYKPIASRISRDRFRELFRYLHFVDNSTLQPAGTSNYDKLDKIKPIIEYLTDTFRTLYNLTRK